jgi:ATP-dependent exoDNAse (exonuclease V) beta subunit
MIQRIDTKFRKMLHNETGRGSQKVEREMRGTFWVIRASAGSGKTFRLVQMYLSCCLSQEQPSFFRSICALTFTNKAAQEMRDRILKEIGLLASGEESAMESLLLEETGLTPGILRARARATREHMLHHYGDFAVMTIDSFVHRLVRSFARDLQLDQGFQIELDEDRLLEEAVDRLLARVGTAGEEELTRLLESFVEQQVEEERDTRVREALMAHARLVDKEHVQPILRALEGWKPAAFEAARKRLADDVRAAQKKVREAAEAALSALAAADLREKDFSHGDIPKWLARTAADPMKASIGVRMAAQLAGEKPLVKAKTPAAVEAAVESVMPEVRTAVETWEATLAGESGGLLKLKDKLRYRMSLAGTLVLLAEELEKVMAEQSVQTFGSLNRQIADLVQTNPAPYIFERIGIRFRHLFIDEFQDTSVTQWHNLVSLYENVLSQGFDALVVGDGKQAIYRWRNGDLRQLEELPQLIGDEVIENEVMRSAAATLARHFRADGLTDNWRTGSAIVHFNNSLFDTVRQALPGSGSRVYNGAEQQARKDFEGTVEVGKLVGENAEERRTGRLDWVLQRVRHHAASRPMADLAVLVRTNRSGAEIAEHLFAHGITPYTDESLQLGRHPVATGVVALLRSLLDPLNPVHVSVFLQSYSALHPGRIDEAGLLEKNVEVKRDKEGERFRHEIRMTSVLADVCPELELVKMSTSPIVALVGHILGALGWATEFAAYAEGILELAREVAARPAGGAGVTAFLKMWDRQGARRSIRVSPGADAVRIMTIHKAKGLEFPVVITPVDSSDVSKFRGEVPVILDRETFGVPAGLLSHSDMKDTPLESVMEDELGATVLDALNVAYVALTRPVEALDILLEFDKDPAAFKPGDADKTIPGRIFAALQTLHGSDILSANPLRLGTPRPVPVPVPVPVGERSSPPVPLVLGAPVIERVAIPRESWQLEGVLTEKSWGRAVHALLAEVRDRSDWFERREKLKVKAESGGLREVFDAADALIQHPKAGETFAEGADEVLAERDWIGSDGEIQRPDRVVRRANRWEIVDFKTGDPKDEHKVQLQGYLRTLSALEPGAVVKGRLVYSQTFEVVEVQLETLF